MAAQASIEALAPSVVPILRPVRSARELRGVRREVCRQMCEGVAFLHRPRGVPGLRGVFHRNLKPSNVLIRGDTVKIAELQVRGSVGRSSKGWYLGERQTKSSAVPSVLAPAASIAAPGKDGVSGVASGAVASIRRARTRRFSGGRITSAGSILGGYVGRVQFDEWAEYPRQLRRGHLPHQRRRSDGVDEAGDEEFAGVWNHVSELGQSHEF